MQKYAIQWQGKGAKEALKSRSRASLKKLCGTQEKSKKMKPSRILGN